MFKRDLYLHGPKITWTTISWEIRAHFIGRQDEDQQDEDQQLLTSKTSSIASARASETPRDKPGPVGQVHIDLVAL